jgi:hypothetical protein
VGLSSGDLLLGSCSSYSRVPMQPSSSGFICAALATSTLFLGCGGGEATATIQRPPSTLDAVSPTSVGASVASTVTVTVIVRDEDGAPLDGVNVSFSVLTGDGSVSPASGLTGAAGTTSGSWQLATKVGVNELRAAVSGLPPVKFTATAVAGAPAAVAKISGDAQQGNPKAALAEPLKVRVTDLHQNSVPNVSVTFTVTSGGGTIQGSPATTDHDGLAFSGIWTLGGDAAEETVIASVGAITVQFTATSHLGPIPGQCSKTDISVPGQIAGELGPADCKVDSSLADTYELTSQQDQVVTISLTSSAFDPRVTVSRNGQLTARSDDVTAGGIRYCDFTSPPDGCHTDSPTTAGSPVRLLVAPGSRLITATSKDHSGAGAYTLTVEAASSEVTNCETVFLELGVTTTQQLQTTDCRVLFGSTPLYYTDDMKVYLTAGSQLHVKMSSSAFEPWLDIFSPTGSSYAACVNPGTADCTFPIFATGYYLISPSSFQENATGDYTLTVEAGAMPLFGSQGVSSAIRKD